jgi:glycosyltransferase involved in cell wall biosynthesis
MAQAIERVVVINDDSVESGGAASIALSSIRELRRRGLPVTLLTGDSGANPELASLGVEVVSLGGQHLLEGNRADAALRGLYSQKTATRLQAWISANDTPGTIYHMHNWHKFLSPSAFVPLRKLAARLIVSVHDYFLSCPNGGYFHYPDGSLCSRTPLGPACLMAACDKRNYAHKVWRATRTAVRQMVFDFCNTQATILAVHEGMVPLLERGKVAHATIRVLRNPVSPWRETRVPAELNDDFLFVGRLDEEKGVSLLARAAARAGVRVRMIGEGPLAAMIERGFPDVELAGWRPRNEISSLCRTARALVMPSRMHETFGLVALEAAMSGIPVLASQSALITDDLVGLGVGVAHKPNDADALAQALTVLAEDDVAVAAMSRRGFDKARILAPTFEGWGDELTSIYECKLASAVWPTRTQSKPLEQSLPC